MRLTDTMHRRMKKSSVRQRQRLPEERSGIWMVTVPGGLLGLNRKARRSSHKNHIKGPKKRTAEDDERFRDSLERLVQARLREIT